MAEDRSAEGFAPLRIARVVRETSDAVSLVLDVPDHCSHRFRYRAGQFLTVRVSLDGRDLRRCYSMSSAPVEDELRITVKRDPGGVVSNWINDTVSAGDELHAAPPEGKFVLHEGVSATAPLVAFAGGSGITPIMSLLRTVLTESDRPVKLFYANRARDSVIFADVLTRLAAAHPDRLTVQHHFDEDGGVVRAPAIQSFAGDPGVGDYYICGPAPFMDTVEKTLLAAGVTKGRLHLERFTVTPIESGAADAQETDEIVIELDHKKTTAAYRKGDTLLQTARSAGLKAPYSCETGSCGTCMARIVEGSARMVNNDALEDDEVAEGWVVTCQALPTSPRVHMIYE
ncbi:ferredoxin--NADP reductase [Mycolicibacterium vaccae]|uniref:Ferredoxin n=1 Tax=Mycolicibacterium vaccae ATCC 25954 TaxID=1194972 RepID=K0UZX8_MYCVA|nr:ferredoxin--NADP reductase [Mycolicibacterium vaccae]ANI41092.1 ferredoxin [Mycolicibacterium vaccae 95051]EJZ12692.1 ferredoxin [Mycolicibacterium vaccae ATCC 25954]MCV7061704.1 ferredoxin--NADP reductase [Mycolicibacterium vaccae]